MRPEKLEQLERSLSNLEAAINGVHQRFSERGDIPDGVIKRILQYREICARQHSLCEDLKIGIVDQNIEQVAQQIKVINGLSAMLVDDVKELLNGLQSQTVADETIIN